MSREKVAIEAIKKNFEISKVLDHYQVKKANSEGSYHCPFHDDKTPSFVAKSGQDYWKCLSGCGNGDQIDFIAKFESINKKQAINKLRQLADEFNIENKTPKENKKTDKKEMELSELSAVHNKYLLERGIHPLTARAFNLKASGKYIMFPHQRNGAICGYKGINIENKKMVVQGKDTRAKLWPDYQFEGIKYLIFNAGEYDCMLLTQKLLEGGLIDYKAVTNTSGENSFPKDLDRLREYPSIEGFKIIYDNDETGKKGALKLANKLHEIGKPVEIYYFSSEKPSGYDISDFFNEETQRTAEDLFNLEMEIYEPQNDVPDKRIDMDGFKFMIPQDYEISRDRGINKITFTSKDEPKIELIANQPILITGRAINTDEKIIKLEITFKVSGIWEKIQVEREVISDSRKIINLSNYGFPVHSGNAKKVVQYLHAFENANDDYLETVYLTHTNGWKYFNNKKIFGFGSNIVGLTDEKHNISFSPEPGFERFAKSLHTEGSFDKWKDLISKLHDYPKVMFSLYASLSAPLLSLVHSSSFLIHLWGNSSLGKTTTMEVAASVWGNPFKDSGGLITSWNTTQVFAERLATFSNDLPMFLDDSQTTNDKILYKILYMVANSTGKGRGSLKGVQDTSSWTSVCFSTGEKMLTESTQYDGAKARTIELAGSPFGRGKHSLVNEVKQTLRENYGFLGHNFIKTLFSYINRENGLQELKTRYNENAKLLTPSSGNEIDGRMSGYFAVVLLAGQLISEELSIDPYPIVKEIFNETIEERSSEGDMPTRALQETISFAQANEKSFLGKADDTVKEYYGIWKEAEYIAFYPHKLKEFLGKSGFSYNSVLRSWAERKWIRKSKEGYSHPIRYEKSLKRLILIEWPVVAETLFL